jgi:hypothetical protein
MILSDRIGEGLLRFELLKTNPDLVAKFDEENRQTEEQHYLSLLTRRISSKNEQRPRNALLAKACSEICTDCAERTRAPSG